MGKKNFWDNEGKEGFFIRAQSLAEYETRSHDYDGNLIDGAVCAIEIENPELTLEECKEKFRLDGLECYIEENPYLVLFEGYKYEEIEDGVIAKMDAIRKIWDLRNGKILFDMEIEGCYY